MLELYPTDREFRHNLTALKDWRLHNKQFDKAFEVKLDDGRHYAAKNAYVKGDGKTFEFDGIRIPVEKIVRVTYYLT